MEGKGLGQDEGSYILGEFRNIKQKNPLNGVGSDVFFILLILVEPAIWKVFFCFCVKDSRDVKGKLGGLSMK